MKTPQEMTASEINRKLDQLDKEYFKLNSKLIEAGRGLETANDTYKKTDPLSLKFKEILDELHIYRNEVARRYGPGAPARLPLRKRKCL